jgi:hypothetical protein
MYEIEKKKKNIGKIARGNPTLLTQPKVICYRG